MGERERRLVGRRGVGEICVDLGVCLPALLEGWLIAPAADDVHAEWALFCLSCRGRAWLGVAGVMHHPVVHPRLPSSSPYLLIFLPMFHQSLLRPC